MQPCGIKVYSIDIIIMTEFIIINAVAVVGLERPVYNVSESVDFVEICIIVTNPVTSCPIPDPFTVTLSSSDDGAGTSR